MTVYILKVGRIYKILARNEIMPAFYSLLKTYPLNKFNYELTAYKLMDQHLKATTKINLNKIVSSIDKSNQLVYTVLVK